MKKILRLLIVIIVLGGLGGGGYWYFSNNPDAWRQAMTDFGLSVDPEEAARLTASGCIEADEVAVAAEVGGRIVELAVDQGDPVAAGQTVVGAVDYDGVLCETEFIQALKNGRDSAVHPEDAGGGRVIRDVSIAKSLVDTGARSLAPQVCVLRPGNCHPRIGVQ